LSSAAIVLHQLMMMLELIPIPSRATDPQSTLPFSLSLSSLNKSVAYMTKLLVCVIANPARETSPSAEAASSFHLSEIKDPDKERTPPELDANPK